MLKIITYQRWQSSYNYQYLVILFFVSTFSSVCVLLKSYCYNVKAILRHFILSLFLITCHIHYASALSATTTQVIHGSAPYLTFDGGVTKGNIQALLGIRLSDGREYVPKNGESNFYPNAKAVDNYYTIELPSNADSFDGIQTLVPIPKMDNYSVIELSKIIGGNNLLDDDGDSYGNITGTLDAFLYDRNSDYLTRIVKSHSTDKLDLCSLYVLTLSIDDAQLSTQYGIPKARDFDHVSQTYYLKAKNGVRTCYASPPARYGGGEGPNWVRGLGFLVVNSHIPEENFPTTGSNGLSFHLGLGGVTPEQVIDANGTTVSAVSGSNSATLLLSTENSELKITLKGPSKASDKKKFSPSLFKLYADSNHSQLLYSFKIERWYLANPDDSGDGSYDEAQIFCDSLGSRYRIPSVGDYTNANSSDWHWGVPGQGNYNLRQVSYKSGERWIGGLFNEWGDFTYGSGRGDDWLDDEYWAADKFGVDSSGGVRLNNGPYAYAITACVTP
ncbi:hypothetical protein A9G28_07020 [Gilliamella sp. Fer1-1]|jgi:hypothetical protein|uniref:hypothetical protein n=1 Tax=Gilliamella sp. Fer1-1 TaxID=3120240 RepID=UPI00080DE043|nr:hypothetical protein [Gilliamella apicola]OCG40982.1 hypothetical protein A9G28_07020 [Gilliamella apicola]